VWPVPPRELNPNVPRHWAVKGRHKKKLRQDAAIAAKVAFGELNIDPPRYTSALVECRFYFATTRGRDADNANASMKAAFDGLTDAGVWIDDKVVSHLPSTLAVDKNSPRVEVIVTEGGSQS